MGFEDAKDALIDIFDPEDHWEILAESVKPRWEALRDSFAPIFGGPWRTLKIFIRKLVRALRALAPGNPGPQSIPMGSVGGATPPSSP